MLKRYALATIELRTKVFYFLVILFVLGVCLGARTGGESEFLSNIAQGYGDAQKIDSAADNFFLTLSADALLLVVVFLLGFSAVSLPVLVLVPFFKGLGVGAAATALYLCDPSFVTILKCVIGFAVTACFSSYLIISAVQASMKLSIGLFSHLVGKCEVFDLWGEGKKYGLKFLLFTVIIVINAVIDTLLSVLLYR